MSGGLLALLDDVVALTKLTAATLDDATSQAVKASAKAAGVVIDDAAVTPRYVTGLAAQRELPIVGRIAIGSLKNKLLFLLPAALLLSAFLPQAITPLLMLGGLYLAFEGYEKVHHMLTPRRARRAQSVKVVGRAGQGRQGARGREGRRRHPHRFHSLGRDHGHRPGRHHRARSADAGDRAGRSSPSSSPSRCTAW